MSIAEQQSMGRSSIARSSKSKTKTNIDITSEDGNE
jgi:hypothetical protein